MFPDDPDGGICTQVKHLCPFTLLIVTIYASLKLILMRKSLNFFCKLDVFAMLTDDDTDFP